VESNPTNYVACEFYVKKCSDLRLRRVGGAWMRPLLMFIVFWLFLKPIFYFIEKIFTGDFITSTASRNRFPRAVLSYPLVQIIISIGP
jgi:hypothetical protein